MKVLLADILVDVKNGRNLENARETAYLKIYQSVNLSYTPHEIGTDWCYVDVSAVDAAMFTITRKLIIENRP